MTVARRPGFDPAVWNGEKPMLEPKPSTFGVGDLVALREPVDANGDPVIRGVVLSVDPNADGEIVLTVARELLKRPSGTYTDVRWEFRYEQHLASAVDPGWHVPSTVFDRSKSFTAAARICLAVGRRHVNGGDWNREDRLLIGGALVLADLGRGGDR